MIKPIHTLLSLLSVGALCAILMWVFPKEGISINEDVTLKFASWDGYFEKDTAQVEVIEDITEFLEVYEVEIDSIAIKDSLLKLEAIRRQELMKVQYTEENTEPMHKFFAKLRSLKNNPSESVRVLHYGDSQIEGDRITGYIRNTLQKEFGGTGPGFVHITEVIPTLAIDQEASENWNRYTINGKKDTTVKHNRYGILAHFNRFAPFTPDWPVDTVVNAWLDFHPGRMTYSKSKKWTRARLYSGYAGADYNMKVLADDSLIFADSIAASESYLTQTFDFSSTPKTLRFEFEGNTGPELYGISFDSPSGIHVDNIALRGSSGTLFKKISKAQLQSQYNTLDIGLIILQFGGNTIPYIDSVEEADRYGNWFKSQIKYIKSMVPNASIMVIGPSDMAIKDMDTFVTRPFLEDVRNAMKNAAFETNCAFWDIYEVMGGRNSMQSWVNAEPPLAGSDYTHFTPAGAKRIAELLYKAVNQDYEEWKLAN